MFSNRLEGLVSSRHQETYVKPKVAKEGEKPKSRQILTKLEAPAFHAFARIHLGRTVTEEQSHADFLAGGDRGAVEAVAVGLAADP